MQLPSSPATSQFPQTASDLRKKDSVAIVAMGLKAVGIALLFLIIAFSLQSTTGLRTVAAGFIYLVLLLLIWRIPSWGVVLTFFFLAVVGGVRRWLIPDFGWPGYDPLILIGPGITLLCFLSLVLSRKVPTDTPLSKYIKYLLVIMALQVFNPLQGGLLVGLGGVLYYIAPLLWFYVGRSYGSLNISLMLYKAAVVAYTLGALYGLKQVFFGLSSSEQEWMKIGGYMALNVSVNAIRVFSTFASQQEFAITLACATTICAAFAIQKKYVYLLPLVVLLPALTLTAARSPIAFGLCAICVQWALMGRTRAVWLPRLCLAMTLGVVGIGWSLSTINTSNLDAGQADILRHQQEGLLNPGESTAPEHLLLVGNGIIYGFTHPLGAGLGSTTLAAGKLAGGNEIEGFGAETDHGNLFISLGAIGGILYVVVTFLIFKQAINLWLQSRNIVFLILIGLLVTVFGQWLAGGLYSLCFLIWFSIGVMDKHFATTQVQGETPAGGVFTKFRSKRGKSRNAVHSRRSGVRTYPTSKGRNVLRRRRSRS